MKELQDAHIAKNWRAFVQFKDRKVLGVLTGIREVDRWLLGLGGVTVVQGDTGANKSTFVMQVAYENLIAEGVRRAGVLVLDKENGEGRLRHRLLCLHHGLAPDKLDMIQDRAELKRLVDDVRPLDLYVYTEAILDTEVLEARVGELATLVPAPRPLILVVDSLQAMNPLDQDQRISLEKWMYFFDRLKLAYNGRLTILVTSEKRRDGYDKAGVGAAKGSNAVEYKAETLLDMSLDGVSGNVKMLVAKHRDGLRGGVFTLAKVLADQTNPRSFIFRLGSAQEVVL